MDKTQDQVMRGGGAKRHFHKQQSPSSSSSGLNAIRGGVQFSEKSKKEKVKSLSAVDKALSSYEMGCNVSDSQKPKRFKLPKKVFNDCNGVSHASVPRKIRSAMKKRSRESILTGSEKVNHKIKGIESAETDCIKKSKKQRNQDWSKRQVSLGSITKDEEEVVETLYALAGMFPDNVPNVKSELNSGSLPNNPSVMQDKEESANATFDASGTTQNSSLSPERSPMGATKINYLNETNGQEHTDFAGSAKFLVASGRAAPETNLRAMPMMGSKSENGGKVALHDSELCLEMGLSDSTQLQISHNGRQPDVEFEKLKDIDCKQERHVIKYQKENVVLSESTALWPGLSPRASAINASYAQSSADKGPDWLNAAIGAPKKELMESCSSGGKISQVVHKKSRKRCAVHVHISHLIRSLEKPKRSQVAKEPELFECHQKRVHQGSKSGLLMEAHNLNGTRDGNSSAAGTLPSATVRNSYETTNNGILQKQCHYHDTSQALPTLGMYGPQKQNFNFLSLSGGSNGLKVNDCFNKGGSSRLEPMSQSQVSYFESLQKQHGLVPIPTHRSQHASTSYLDQLSLAGPQVRLQQPHYYGTPLCGAHSSSTPTSTVSYKQQQQSFWAAQLAAQGGSGVNCNVVRAQYPLDWQSGRHESSAVSPYAQVMLPHSPASLHGSKINSISEQQIFSLASSLPTSRTNGRNSHLPLVCEDSRGRLRSSGTPSLQLLCEERI